MYQLLVPPIITTYSFDTILLSRKPQMPKKSIVFAQNFNILVSIKTEKSGFWKTSSSVRPLQILMKFGAHLSKSSVLVLFQKMFDLSEITAASTEKA